MMNLYKDDFYYESNPSQFFNLLPNDWTMEISQVWEQYEGKAKVYLLIEDKEIRAGGIVFNACPPDMLLNQIEANLWLEAGYLYVGFIWVVPAYRKQKYGSKWLKALKNKYPFQKYWLTTEEEGLNQFYIQNGFHLVKYLSKIKEWLLTYEP